MQKKSMVSLQTDLKKLDRNIKEILDTDLRTANIISDILQEVGVVEVLAVINPTTGRKIKGTKLLPKWQW